MGETLDNKTQRINYFLVTIVLILEVTIFFDDIFFEFNVPNVTKIIAFAILLYFFIKRKRKFDRLFILFVLLVLFLILIQGVLFGFSPISFLTYPAAILFIPYFLYKVIGPRVFEYLVNIIYYTAIITSVIWLAQALFPPINDFLQYMKYSDSIFTQGRIDPTRMDRVSLAFIYTIPPKDFEIFGIETIRNWGLYHEPGAFAVFLIIAIGINTIIQQSFVNKKNIIMSVILLTTFSTAGYLALFLIILNTVLISKINISLKVLTVLLFIIISIISYIQLDFMHEKIMNQYENEIDDDTIFEKEDGGRIWRVRAAINLLSTSPIIGRGIVTAARDFGPGSYYYFTGAGIWRTLSSYGLLFAPLIYYLFYRGTRRLCMDYNFHPSFALFFFLAIAIGATSQEFFMDNITMLLFINGLIVCNNKEKEEKIN